MSMRSLTWDGDNAADYHSLLSEYLVRIAKEGTRLHILSFGISILLSLGDSLVLNGDKLRVIRGE